jgi:hypothetical protein
MLLSVTGDQDRRSIDFSLCIAGFSELEQEQTKVYATSDINQKVDVQVKPWVRDSREIRATLRITS